MSLTIALEPPEELDLQDRTRLFLEIYGNSLVRPANVNFIAKKSTQFVHMVRDLDIQVYLWCDLIFMSWLYIQHNNKWQKNLLKFE
jgi:dynein assembly factor 3